MTRDEFAHVLQVSAEFGAEAGWQVAQDYDEKEIQTLPATDCTTPVTGLDKLIELQAYVKDQCQLEEDMNRYHTMQRALAYKRVLNRLNPIVNKLKKVQQQLQGRMWPEGFGTRTSR